MMAESYHRSEDPKVYRRNASFVFSSANTGPVMELLDPQPGDKILDLGCGSGELTLEISKLIGPHGTILGIDASVDMITEATLAIASSPSSQDLPTVRDGHDPPPAHQLGTFDKVFSNAALHWMKRDPSLVLGNVHAYLKPGGRFAAEMGGFMNCVGVRGQLHAALRRRGMDPASCDPWFFPTADEYRELAESAGFKVESCDLVPRMTELPRKSGLKGWLKTFAGPFLNEIQGEDERETIVQEVEDALRPDAYDGRKGVWYVMYVRLRILAFKPDDADDGQLASRKANKS